MVGVSPGWWRVARMWRVGITCVCVDVHGCHVIFQHLLDAAPSRLCVYHSAIHSILVVVVVYVFIDIVTFSVSIGISLCGGGGSHNFCVHHIVDQLYNFVGLCLGL